jgi:hypothetical protein
VLAGAGSALAETKAFAYTGKEQEFKVPAGVTSVNVVAVGSQGGGTSRTGAGGAGAIVTGELSVTPEHALFVEVGGVPFDGGGTPTQGGDGGGASDVRAVSIGAEPSPGNEASLHSRLLVAAGGGGGGSRDIAGFGCAGGSGGAGEEKGANGTSCRLTGAEGGGAGEANKGGAGGLGYFERSPFSLYDGEAGKLGAGGTGGPAYGGGGGGGLYGGGGGGVQGVAFRPPPSSGGNGGGGGGSNLVPAGGSHELAAAGQPASVTFTYMVLPTSKKQCKNGGWKKFGGVFKNQGQCVKFVEAEKHAQRLRRRLRH